MLYSFLVESPEISARQLGNTALSDVTVHYRLSVSSWLSESDFPAVASWALQLWNKMTPSFLKLLL